MKANRIRIGIVMGTDYRAHPPGGTRNVIRSFLRHARERNFDVWLFGMSTSRDEPVGKVSKRRIYGRDYPFIPMFYFDAQRHANHKPLVPLRIQALMAYLRKRRLIESMKFDLLYLHTPEALPFLWHKRQPVLYHIHATQEGMAQYSRYPIFRTHGFSVFYRRWVDAILKRGDEFIVIDQESYDLYTQRMPERRERFHLLPGETDTEQFRPLEGSDRQEARRRFGLPAEGKMVLYVGRLSEVKGVELVLRAFGLVARQSPDAYLALAGEGESRPGLEALARELGLSDRIFFLGHLPHLPSPELPRLFNCADVSLVSSLSESFALVITEALACGTPVVSTPVGIAPTVIRNGVTGYLLESRDPEEMAGRILQIIRDGESNRGACVEAANNYAQMSGKICDVIEQLCARSNAPAGRAQVPRPLQAG